MPPNASLYTRTCDRNPPLRSSIPGIFLHLLASIPQCRSHGFVDRSAGKVSKYDWTDSRHTPKPDCWHSPIFLRRHPTSLHTFDSSRRGRTSEVAAKRSTSMDASSKILPTTSTPPSSPFSSLVGAPPDGSFCRPKRWGRCRLYSSSSRVEWTNRQGIS